MRRGLLVALIVGALSLVAAGTAAATVTASWDGGFIGRGDVIAYAGKAALVESPTVEYRETWVNSGWCNALGPDDNPIPVLIKFTIATMWSAHARHAPGNGTITGYTFTPDDMIGGDFWADDCGGMIGGPLVSHTITLTFNGVPIPISSTG